MTLSMKYLIINLTGERMDFKKIIILTLFTLTCGVSFAHSGTKKSCTISYCAGSTGPTSINYCGSSSRIGEFSVFYLYAKNEVEAQEEFLETFRKRPVSHKSYKSNRAHRLRSIESIICQ